MMQHICIYISIRELWISVKVPIFYIRRIPNYNVFCSEGLFVINYSINISKVLVKIMTNLKNVEFFRIRINQQEEHSEFCDFC